MDQILQEFTNLPPFTRTWLSLSLLITTSYTFDVIQYDQLFLDWDAILQNHTTRSQTYRLITCFCTCDGGGKLNNFPTLFLLYTMYMHSKGYELNPFRANSGSAFIDTIFTVVICTVLLLLTHIIVNTFVPQKYKLYPILTRNLVSCFIYLWSKKNPNVIIQLNFIPVQGAYLPYAHVGLSLFLKNRLHEMIHGFCVGHVYFFLMDVVPSILGFRILFSPRILTQLLCNAHDLEYQIEGMQQNSMQYFHETDGADNVHVYAKLGNLEALQNIAASANARSLFMATDNNGWQPIHEAIRGSHLNVIQFLIEQQVDIFARTNNGDTPISLARQFCNDNEDIVELILNGMDEQR